MRCVPTREDGVGVVEQRLETLVHPRGPRVERVAGVEAALALTGGDHRRLQELGELGQLGGGVAQDHPTARPDHGSLRRYQDVGRAGDLVGIGRRRARSRPRRTA